MPRTAASRPPPPRHDAAVPPAVRVLVAALCGLTAVYVGALVLGVGRGDGLRTWLLPVLLLGSAAVCAWRAATATPDRWAWRLFAISMVCWALGELSFGLWFARGGRDPAVSGADLPWLLQYPTAAWALALLLRRRAGRLTRALQLDALIGAVAVSAVAGAAVASLPLDGQGVLDHLIAVAYPAGDVLLLVFIAGTFAVGGRGLSVTWWLLAGSFAVQVGTDLAYMQKTAAGAYVAGTWTDIGWPLCTVLLALAALRARDVHADEAQADGRLGPGLVFGGLAVAVVIVDHVQGLPWPVLGLAVLALALVTVRMVVAVRENARLLAASQAEAHTDALTGLGNRRALMRDLDEVHAFGTPTVLAMYDLNGFKRYNDVFGHPAGDDLLRRLAARLRGVADELPDGRAYRLGGDEFCVLAASGRATAGDVVERGAAALVQRGEGFTVAASAGWACAPLAGGPAAVLGEADRHMYRDKQADRPSPGQQTAGALVAAVRARHPDLGEHLSEVAELAADVGRRLGLDRRAVEEVRDAAELHDLGKLAIPDAILSKPAPLDAEEWTFMRRHTLVGERILLAAPDLGGVAALVRASHERWDGGGYPDGLKGEEIPLGARIVAVCDAYDAMVTRRPYREPLAPEAAVVELRAAAGRQFDPVVVEAFAGVMPRPGVPA